MWPVVAQPMWSPDHAVACRVCGNRTGFLVRALVWLGDTTSDPRIERWDFDPTVAGDMLVEDTGGRSVLCVDCGNSWECDPEGALPSGAVV